MTKIDIISGFLGAGKTTLIKKLLSEGFKGEQVVLIENEFGEIGIDGGFLKEAGIEIREMNSGCILCCLLYTSPSPRDGLPYRMPASALKKKKTEIAEEKKGVRCDN